MLLHNRLVGLPVGYEFERSAVFEGSKVKVKSIRRILRVQATAWPIHWNWRAFGSDLRLNGGGSEPAHSSIILFAFYMSDTIIRGLPIYHPVKLSLLFTQIVNK